MSPRDDPNGFGDENASWPYSYSKPGPSSDKLLAIPISSVIIIIIIKLQMG